jgi:transposase
MIALPTHGRVYLACGSTDMRRGFDGLAVMVQEVLMQDPHSGALFAFKGKRGDLIKLLWWDGQGLCLFAKRLEKGRFIWPMAATGTVSLSAAQLTMLLEGIDWRAPVRSWRPELAGCKALTRLVFLAFLAIYDTSFACQTILPRFPMTSNPCAASWPRNALNSTPNAPRAWRRKAHFSAGIC